MSRLVALLASHDRRDRTLACLEALFGQSVDDVEIDAVLVDDGSTDGTAEAVQRRFDRVDVIRGDGTLFWAGAMALAERHALGRRPDYLLWLNDDVRLFPTALATLISACEAGEPRIVAGYTVDPDSGVPSYGGARRIDWHPMRYDLFVPTNGRAESCDTFNGNVVLVPRAVYDAVGGIDGRFAHAFADFDYGLRARSLGFDVAVAAPAVGVCRRDTTTRWRDTSLTLVERYRLLLGRKGVPISSAVRYLRRHGGRLWPLYLSATYVKVAVDQLRARVSGADPSRT
jgi:GT2 family glycosyltransferase